MLVVLWGYQQLGIMMVKSVSGMMEAWGETIDLCSTEI
jgi:hypothetical protein